MSLVKLRFLHKPWLPNPIQTQNEQNSMFLGLSQLNNGTQFLSLVAIIDSYHNFEPQNPLNCA